MSKTDEDISFEEIIKEVTEYAIYAINHNSELYERVKGKSARMFKKECYKWAEEHGNLFGDLFQTELDLVDWKQAISKV